MNNNSEQQLADIERRLESLETKVLENKAYILYLLGEWVYSFVVATEALQSKHLTEWERVCLENLLQQTREKMGEAND